jgi:hypothetical protein
MNATSVIVVFFCLFAGASLAQEQKPTPVPEPKTKLEAFEAQTGAVVIRGLQDIGVLHGLLGTSATVEARESTDAASGKKEFGIAITVTETANYQRKETLYIDYDEIDSLINGIDYIAKVDKTVTTFDRFEADYHTKGDLYVAAFTETKKVQASVQCGRFSRATAYYTLEQLSAFRDLIKRAKARLDAAKR